MQNILYKDVPPPSEINSEIPEKVDLVLEMALKKEADDRFQTAKEFKENLKNN